MSTATTVRRREIINHANGLREYLVRTRRDIYMHPELSHKEVRTAGLVARRLRELGFEVRTGLGGNGVVGVLRGVHDGKVVAFRADMDALAIRDVIGAPYRSVVAGVKHACGHDVHTTIGLGIAEVLSARRERLPGTVKLLFQPAEETLRGAKPMVRDGALKDPRPDAVFAWHVIPAQVGTVLCARGIVLAGTDRFQVTFRPSSAEPEPLDAAVEHCRQSLRTLTEHSTERHEDPHQLAALEERLLADAPESRDFSIVNCGPVARVEDSAGLGFSVTVRATPRRRRDIAIEQVAQTVACEAVRANADYAILHKASSPDTVNDAALGAAAILEIESVIGADNAIQYDGTFPFSSEDFGFFTERIPGAFLFLGTANKAKRILSALHSADFDIDEDALVIGVAAMANAMVGFLERGELTISQIA